jgi:isoquinoline 1-oxidoreductase beta subunit
VAAHLPAPANVTLKDPAQFKYIGKLRHKRDAAAKVCGRFKYSIDVQLPGMLVAVIQRAPVVGAKVLSVDSAAALQVPGVRQVLAVPGRPDVLGGNLEGVAVLAETFWAAQQGRKVLEIKWSDSPLAGFDSAELATAQAAAISDPKSQTIKAMTHGDVDAQWSHAAQLIEADYHMPYKVQNPLEPICITAQVKDNAITYWGGVQVPSSALEAAQTVCGIAKDKVTINELVSGGSFGAREAKYWLFEVAYLAQQTGVPVKLLNSREDEMHALFNHPATLHRVKGALDAQGKLNALQLHAVSPASPEQWEPGYFERPDHMDYSTTEAITAWDFAYRPPHLQLNWVKHESHVPSGWYRSVSFIPNVFAVESFMDELAHAAGRSAGLQSGEHAGTATACGGAQTGCRTRRVGPAVAARHCVGHCDPSGLQQFYRRGGAGRDGRWQTESREADLCGRLRSGRVAGRRRGADLRRTDVGPRSCVVRSPRHPTGQGGAEQFSRLPRDPHVGHAGHRYRGAGWRAGQTRWRRRVGQSVGGPAIANALFALTGVRQRSTPLSLG